MKKALTIVLLAGTVLVTACSQYTCPTYSKAPEKAAPSIENQI